MANCLLSVRAGAAHGLHASDALRLLRLRVNQTGTRLLDLDRADVGRKIQKMDCKAGKQLLLLGNEC